MIVVNASKKLSVHLPIISASLYIAPECDEENVSVAFIDFSSHLVSILYYPLPLTTTFLGISILVFVH